MSLIISTHGKLCQGILINFVLATKHESNLMGELVLILIQACLKFQIFIN